MFFESVSRSAANSVGVGQCYENPITTSFSAYKKPILQTMDSLLDANLMIVKAEARFQYFNNEYAKRAISLVTDGVVGPTGFKLQSRATNAKGKPDKLLKQAVLKSLTEWSRRENCHYQGELSLVEIERLIVDSLGYDGECFIRLRTGKGLRLSLEIIDSMMINPNLRDVSGYTLQKGHYIRFGIEYNAKNKPVAYYVNSSQGGATDLTSGYHIGEYERVPAREIIHVFKRYAVGQRRGIPMLATSINSLVDRAEYTGYVRDAAKIGAQNPLYIELGENSMPSAFDASGNPVTPKMDISTRDMKTLPPGSKIASPGKQYPSGDFSIYSTNMLRQAFSGIGIDYAIAANDFSGVNYSSLKVGRDSQKDFFLEVQQMLIEQFLTPVFEIYIDNEVLMNRIEIDRRLSLTEQRYKPHEWFGRRWPHLDPAKAATFYEKMLQSNSTSVSAIIRENSQQEPLEVFEEIAEEKALMQELGITPSEVVSAVTNQQTAEPSNEQEEDDAGDSQATPEI